MSFGSEDAIPVIIVLFFVIALIGGLAQFIPVIKSIPVIYPIANTIHSWITMPFQSLKLFIGSASLTALIAEVLIIVLLIVIIMKTR